MFDEGNLLYFSPFIFKNGAPPQPKFFLVLKTMEKGLLLASLPTSKDHVPGDMRVQRPELFQAIKDCLKNSRMVKNKFRKML